MKKIALFGGSFNPPGQHHIAIVKALAPHFDMTVVIPCGPRPDKNTVNDVEPIFRAAMVDMAFRGMPKVVVDLFDLERPEFTRTFHLEQLYSEGGEIWHVVGADLVKGGKKGSSAIQREWVEGEKLWKQSRFAVVKRPGFALDESDLPPKHLLINIDNDLSSSLLREKVLHNETIRGSVPIDVAQYIDRHRLYRGFRADRTSSLTLDEFRPMVIVDKRNPQAVKLESKFPKSEEKDPNMIIVIGGDGAMLRAVRRQWRHRVPFYGVNAGHMGFLLNQVPEGNFIGRPLLVQHLPLLRVEIETEEGDKRSDVAFNDAWVERATGQTAWIEVSVNGKVRMQNLMADGALVATAAGSASYARAMGAAPLPYNTRALLLVGSNVLRPFGWKSAVLPMDSVVHFKTLDLEKRPLAGFIDGVQQGRVKNLTLSLSKIASVELAFEAGHDPAEKLAQIQFPSVT